jgi:hypothetical protein
MKTVFATARTIQIAGPRDPAPAGPASAGHNAAMSQENVEMLRALYEQWNTGERAVDTTRFDPAIELESPLSSVVGEPYRGYAGMEEWIRDVDEQFSVWQVRGDDMRAVGDRVLIIWQRARSRTRRHDRRRSTDGVGRELRSRPSGYPNPDLSGRARRHRCRRARGGAGFKLTRHNPGGASVWIRAESAAV